MSDADKRTVATDAVATLGMVIDTSQKRDAIHLAVEPVVAGERLLPGEHVNVIDGTAWSTAVGTGLGIVDPFLRVPVGKGERFWFIMYPRQITSLRHVWAHPAFPDEPGTPALAPKIKVKPPPARGHAVDTVAEARQTIRRIVRTLGDGLTYSGIMSAAAEWLSREDYLVQQGSERWRDDFPAFTEEFWNAYAIVTGETVPTDKRQNFFSCSC